MQNNSQDNSYEGLLGQVKELEKQIKNIESQENEICDNEENLLDFLDEQNEKQTTQQKKQIEILVSSLEQQVQKLEHNFSEAYFAQDNSYKGTLLGINVQNKKITPFYSWDSCFEQIDQIQHNKDDLNDINQLYKNGQKKSILEKYQFIITKSQFNLLIQCLKCQLKNEDNASNYDLDSYQNIILKQLQQQAEQIVDQPSLDVQQQQIQQQKIVSVLIDNQAEKQQEFEKNESINQPLQSINQINSENNKNLDEQSNTLQANNQLIQDIHNKTLTTESIQNQTFQKPFLNFQKINNNNLSSIQKTEIEQKSQQENNQSPTGLTRLIITYEFLFGLTIIKAFKSTLEDQSRQYIYSGDCQNYRTYDQEQDRYHHQEQNRIHSKDKTKYQILTFVLSSLFSIVFMNSNLITQIRTFGRYYSNGFFSLLAFLIFAILTKLTIKFVTYEDTFNICAICSSFVYLIAGMIDNYVFNFSNLNISLDFISSALASINIMIIPIYFSKIINIFNQLSYVKLSIGFYIISIFLQYKQLNYCIDYECFTTSISTSDTIQYTYSFLNLFSIAYIYLFIHIVNSKKLQQKFKDYQKIK
ncbi:hypothetical protein ABPG72_017918 [Tetrahymena utriculariae]